MGDKQEESETVVQFENYSLVAIMETRKNDSHNWNAMTEDYELFRRDG